MGCLAVTSSRPISSLNLCRLHAGVSNLWHGPSDATAATWDKLRHMVKVSTHTCFGKVLPRFREVLVCLGIVIAQACLKRAAVRICQLGLGSILGCICCCASCMLFSEDSSRLHAAVQVMCLTLAAPNMLAQTCCASSAFCRGKHRAPCPRPPQEFADTSLPTFRSRGRAVCSAAGRWTMVCWTGCCLSVSCGTGPRLH